MTHLRAMTSTGTTQAASGADFSHVEHWIFDLDNTLYRADSNVFGQIEARMTLFVARLLKLDAQAARPIQKAYYREHGTTLNGLMRLHGTDPEEYLDFVHDIDLTGLDPDTRLGEALARLPGKRHVFTNGCRHHSARILDRLRISPLIDEIWDIRSIGFVPKPQTQAYDKVIADGGIAPARAAMFEDSARNLVPAHGLGMTTVWLNTDAPWSKDGPEIPVASHGYIDHEIADLGDFLSSIRI